MRVRFILEETVPLWREFKRVSVPSNAELVLGISLHA